jgi:hypothetical protein
VRDYGAADSEIVNNCLYFRAFRNIYQDKYLILIKPVVSDETDEYPVKTENLIRDKKGATK